MHPGGEIQASYAALLLRFLSSEKRTADKCLMHIYWGQMSSTPEEINQLESFNHHTSLKNSSVSSHTVRPPLKSVIGWQSDGWLVQKWTSRTKLGERRDGEKLCPNPSGHWEYIRERLIENRQQSSFYGTFYLLLSWCQKNVIVLHPQMQNWL